MKYVPSGVFPSFSNCLCPVGANPSPMLYERIISLPFSKYSFRSCFFTKTDVISGLSAKYGFSEHAPTRAVTIHSEITLINDICDMPVAARFMFISRNQLYFTYHKMVIFWKIWLPVRHVRTIGIDQSG